jgi:hypothetical protein
MAVEERMTVEQQVMRANVKKFGGDLVTKLDPSVSIICVSPSTNADKLQTLTAQCAPTQTACVDVGWIPLCVRSASLVAPQLLHGSLPPLLSGVTIDVDSIQSLQANDPPLREAATIAGNDVPSPAAPSPSRKRRSPVPATEGKGDGGSPPRPKEPRKDGGGGGGEWTGGWQDDKEECVLRWISDGFVPTCKVSTIGDNSAHTCYTRSHSSTVINQHESTRALTKASRGRETQALRGRSSGWQ